MPVYPVLRVKADSQNIISTDGRNEVTGGTTLTNNADGTNLTTINATCFLTVTSADYSTTVARTSMTYISPGLWTYALPATAFPGGRGPWTVKVEIYDAFGTSGSLLRTFYATAKEVD